LFPLNRSKTLFSDWHVTCFIGCIVVRRKPRAVAAWGLHLEILDAMGYGSIKKFFMMQSVGKYPLSFILTRDFLPDKTMLLNKLTGVNAPWYIAPLKIPT